MRPFISRSPPSDRYYRFVSVCVPLEFALPRTTVVTDDTLSQLCPPPHLPTLGCPGFSSSPPATCHACVTRAFCLMSDSSQEDPSPPLFSPLKKGKTRKTIAALIKNNKKTPKTSYVDIKTPDTSSFPVAVMKQRIEEDQQKKKDKQAIKTLKNELYSLVEEFDDYANGRQLYSSDGPLERNDANNLLLAHFLQNVQNVWSGEDDSFLVKPKEVESDHEWQSMDFPMNTPALEMFFHYRCQSFAEYVEKVRHIDDEDLVHYIETRVVRMFIKDIGSVWCGEKLIYDPLTDQPFCRNAIRSLMGDFDKVATNPKRPIAENVSSSTGISDESTNVTDVEIDTEEQEVKAKKAKRTSVVKYRTDFGLQEIEAPQHQKSVLVLPCIEKYRFVFDDLFDRRLSAEGMISEYRSVLQYNETSSPLPAGLSKDICSVFNVDIARVPKMDLKDVYNYDDDSIQDRIIQIIEHLRLEEVAKVEVNLSFIFCLFNPTLKDVYLNDFNPTNPIREYGNEEYLYFDEAKTQDFKKGLKKTEVHELNNHVQCVIYVVNRFFDKKLSVHAHAIDQLVYHNDSNLLWYFLWCFAHVIDGFDYMYLAGKMNSYMVDTAEKVSYLVERAMASEWSKKNAFASGYSIGFIVMSIAKFSHDILGYQSDKESCNISVKTIQSIRNIFSAEYKTFRDGCIKKDAPLGFNKDIVNFENVKTVEGTLQILHEGNSLLHFLRVSMDERIADFKAKYSVDSEHIEMECKYAFIANDDKDIGIYQKEFSKSPLDRFTLEHVIMSRDKQNSLKQVFTRFNHFAWNALVYMPNVDSDLVESFVTRLVSISLLLNADYTFFF
eukprot:764435-Hanusia_phi.AAC.4